MQGVGLGIYWVEEKRTREMGERERAREREIERKREKERWR